MHYSVYYMNNSCFRTNEIILGEVLVPHGDFQGLLGTLVVLDVVRELLQTHQHTHTWLGTGSKWATVKSFYFVGLKFRGSMMMMDMHLNSRIFKLYTQLLD